MGKKRGKPSDRPTFKHIKLSGSGKHAQKHASGHVPKHAHKHIHDSFLEHLGVHTEHHIPLGIKILTAYTLFLAFLYLLAAIMSPMAIVFGILITGLTGKLITAAYIVVLLAIAYGFVTREKWVWKLAMAWYAYSMVDVLISGFSINSYFDLLLNFLVMMLFFTFAANAVMLWYVWSKKTYFLGHAHPRVSRHDTIFLISIMVIASLFIVVAGFSLAKFTHDTSTMARQVALDIKLAFPGEEAKVCSSKDLPERDVCYLTLSILKRNTMFCNSISSDFYKITCNRGDIIKSKETIETEETGGINGGETG